MRLMLTDYVGGFDFGTNSDTQYYLSNMASSQDNRATFISSVASYIQKYALNGIDLGESTQDEHTKVASLNDD
jgi:hypothetical protein